MFLRLLAMLGTAMLYGVSAPSLADDAPAAQRAAQLAAGQCATCHRPRPADNPALVPVLHGQQMEYLAWQLRAYRLGFRDDPAAHDQMWAAAGKLDDSLIDALAAYYGAQPTQPGTPAEPSLAARGRALYESGAPFGTVGGCTGCHGQKAEGKGVFPRLAGQRADYVVRQLSLIQRYLRNVGVMHSTVEALSEDDLAALSAYLQSL